MTDFSVDLERREEAPKQATRLPVGVGLTIGAFVAVALWTVISIGLRALLA